MDWYVEVKYNTGMAPERMYCTTRQEARDCRRDILGWQEVISATIHRVA